jgi:bla regulator protein BlaR1
MIPSQLLPLANHLWQTTLFASAAGLLTLLLRKNRAYVRYWLWIVASVKFLIPFSVLMDVGGLLRRHTAAAVSSAPVATGLSFAIEQVSEPFTSTERGVAIPGAHWSYTDVIVPVLIALWAVGFAWLVLRWAFHWWRVSASVRTASSLNLPIGWPVKSSPEFGEPGVFGVVRPVLLLPDGILECLAPPEMDAIVAHELCHIRHRDNLVTAIHMAVESLFWFHPLVWWVGARLIEERERACDENVLQAGGDPQAYAEGILKICESYLASPLACLAGVTGGNLKRRIETIVAQRAVYPLTSVRKILLVVAGATAVAAPILIGIVRIPVARAQSDAQPRLEFDVASVKENHSGRLGSDGFQISHGSLTVKNVSLKAFVEAAYGVQGSRVVGGPGWVSSDRYDIVAKGPAGASKPQVWLMLRSLLADRFKVSLRNEVRELPIYSLEMGKSGPKLSKQADADCQDVSAPAPADSPVTLPCGTVFRAWGPQGGILGGRKVSISGIVDGLSGALERPVVDKTGLTGTYNFDLQWTPEGYQPGPGGEGESRRRVEPVEPGPSILTAVQEQLGLKLVAGKGPVQILVIDHAERPSGN